MYNEKIKNEYLSVLPRTTAKTHKSYFSKVEPYENKLQKDIVFFSKEEFAETVHSIKGISLGSSLYNFVGCFKKYGKWYSENYTFIDYQSVFTVDYLQIAPFYYTSSLELISDIDLVVKDKIKEYEIPSSVISIYLDELRMKYDIAVGVILLSWVGLTVKEIIDLKSENILQKENKIFIESRNDSISVDSHTMRILTKMKMGSSYAKIEKNLEAPQTQNDYILTIEDFQYTEFFLKKRGKSADYANPVSTKLIDLSMGDFNKNSKGKVFSPISLRENGMFYRAYKRSKTMPNLQFKIRNNDEDYYAIFDEDVKKISKNKFKELKYKYKAYVKLFEKTTE